MDKLDIFHFFIEDLFSYGNVSCIHSDSIDNFKVIQIIKTKKLDYDDAYQVMISRKYELQIVTFDKDFKNSGIKTFNPIEALEIYLKNNS